MEKQIRPCQCRSGDLCNRFLFSLELLYFFWSFPFVPKVFSSVQLVIMWNMPNRRVRTLLIFLLYKGRKWVNFICNVHLFPCFPFRGRQIYHRFSEVLSIKKNHSYKVCSSLFHGNTKNHFKIQWFSKLNMMKITGDKQSHMFDQTSNGNHRPVSSVCLKGKITKPYNVIPEFY